MRRSKLVNAFQVPEVFSIIRRKAIAYFGSRERKKGKGKDRRSFNI